MFFMKRLSFLVIAACIAFTGFKLAFEPIEIGSSIPLSSVKLKDVSGKEVSIETAKKTNGVLVMFSCNTCPYVIKNQARTKAIAEYALQHNVGVILVNSNEATRTDDDSFEEMQAYAKQQGYKWYYAVDKNSKLADAFGATRTPEVFLFNKEGKLVYKGAIDDNPSEPDNVKREHLKFAIEEQSKGKDISVKSSRSVGCTIKRL
jgi:thioredoxin-related protein